MARALDSEGVVSLGGGAVLDPQTRERLSGCRVAFLTVTAEAVEPRLAGGSRPLVRGGIADWERIFAERRPIYEQLATQTFDTSRRPYSRIAEEVAEWARTAVTEIVVAGAPGPAPGIQLLGLRRPGAARAARRPVRAAHRQGAHRARPDPRGAGRAPSRAVERPLPGAARGDPGCGGRKAGRGRRLLLADHGADRLHPIGCRGRPRRGSDDRPRRLRRGDLAARDRRHPAADHRARHGRRRRGRQDRHQHRGGQEPRRSLPRAACGAVRPRRARRAAEERTAGRVRRGRQGGLHRRAGDPRPRRGGCRCRDRSEGRPSSVAPSSSRSP